jgi:hypothetical protein
LNAYTSGVLSAQQALGRGTDITGMWIWAAEDTSQALRPQLNFYVTCACESTTRSRPSSPRGPCLQAPYEGLVDAKLNFRLSAVVFLLYIYIIKRCEGVYSWPDPT